MSKKPRQGGKKPDGRDKATRLAAILQESLDGVLSRMKINPKRSDYLVVSDGSGSDYSRACGYASVVINLKTRERKLLFGSMSNGTVNIAELMAVIQSLDYIVGMTDKESDRSGITKQVHVLTDSQYCETTGNTNHGRMARRNVGVWTLFEAFARRGLCVTWHHVKRSTVGLNILCDMVSKGARKSVSSYNVDSELSRFADLNLADVNP